MKLKSCSGDKPLPHPPPPSTPLLRKSSAKSVLPVRFCGASVREQEGWTSLVILWLRLCIPNAGGLSSIPSQGTRFHVLQLKDPGTSKLEKKKKKEQEGNPSHEFPATSLALLWPVRSHGIYYGCLQASDIFCDCGREEKS